MEKKSSPKVRRKKKEGYDVENLKLCREIRSCFDYLIHLIEKNRFNCFSELKKIVAERKRRFGGKSFLLTNGKDRRYFYHFNFLMRIRSELEIISSANIPGKALDDADIMKITISYIHERISELYLKNINLVKKIAYRYAGNDDYLQRDLAEEGFLGIQKVAVFFDETAGVKFSTVAAWWIRQAISRAMMDKYGDIIRKPVHIFNRTSFLKKKIALLLENGESASHEALSKITKMPLKKIKEALQLKEISLDMLFSDDGELIEFIPSDAPNPEEYFTQSSAEEAVCELVGSLNEEKDRIIISMRFGINGYKREYTLEEIGERFDLTRERIRQIEVKVLKTLRFRANAMGLNLSTVF